jgi:hypothetical protein
VARLTGSGCPRLPRRPDRFKGSTLSTGTENASAVGGPGPSGAEASGRTGTGRSPAAQWVWRYRWPIVALLVIAVSALLARHEHSRPGYDPYGWLIWGYQTLHGSLNLGGAPSWKPMPLLFTAPFALFGHYQLWLWMTTAYAMSFAGCVFAARIAFRLVDEDGAHRWPAIAAGAFAFVLPLCIYDSTHYSYLHYIFSAQSDPPLVSCVLLAIDMALMGRRRWAIGALTLASLGRPEAWPAEFFYALWCLRQDRTMFRFLLGNLLVILFMWFGIPEITNQKPLIAGDLAADSPRMLHGNKIIGTISRYKALNQWSVWVLAGLGAAWAAFRYRRRDHDPTGSGVFVLALFGNCVLWMLVEIVFSLQGLPGVPRYMFEPGVVAIVIGAVGLGWLLSEIPRFFRVPWAAGLVVAVGLIAAIVPGAVTRLRAEHTELKLERARTAEISLLAGFVHELGGIHAIEACGSPVLNVEYVSVFGWLTHLNTGQIGYRANYELHQPHPSVLITPLPNGWSSYLWQPAAATASSCDARMRVLDVVTPSHPGGEIVPNRTPPVETPLPERRRHPAR